MPSWMRKWSLDILASHSKWTSEHHQQLSEQAKMLGEMDISKKSISGGFKWC